MEWLSWKQRLAWVIMKEEMKGGGGTMQRSAAREVCVCMCVCVVMGGDYRGSPIDEVPLSHYLHYQ